MLGGGSGPLHAINASTATSGMDLNSRDRRRATTPCLINCQMKTKEVVRPGQRPCPQAGALWALALRLTAVPWRKLSRLVVISCSPASNPFSTG